MCSNCGCRDYFEKLTDIKERSLQHIIHFVEINKKIHSLYKYLLTRKNMYKNFKDYILFENTYINKYF